MAKKKYTLLMRYSIPNRVDIRNRGVYYFGVRHKVKKQQFQQ
jgi:hypothetical protein